MKQLLINLFGQYTPLTDSNGDIITSIAGIDFPWIFGILIFVILLFCLLKILGGFLNGK